MRVIVKFLVPNQHGTLTYRRDLSPSLQKTLGRSRFFQNFGTTNEAEALPLYQKFHSEVEEQIAAALKGERTVTMEEAEAIADRWYLEASVVDKAARDAAERPIDNKAIPERERGGDSAYMEAATIISTELEFENWDVVAGEVAEALSLSGVFVPPGTRSWRRVAAAVGAKVIRNLRRKEARGQGDWTEADKPAPSIGVRLVALKDRWALNKKRRKTIDEAAKAVDDFTAFAGPLAAEQITTKNLADFRDDLLAKGNAAATVRKKIGFIKAMFQHAINDGVIAGPNPALSIKVVDNVRAYDKRDLLSLDELRLIFSQPLFTQCELPTQEKAGGAMAFWLPLIFLFSGIRPNEIAQLRREDFTEEDETLVMSILGEVKTVAARRDVPVHSELIRIGFKRYVETIPSGLIFPDLIVDKNGSHAQPFSDWFSRWKIGLGLTSTKRSLYSLRHNFTQAATVAGIPDSTLQALIGHSRIDVLNTNYRKYFPIPILKAALDKVVYPKLDLSGVTWKDRTEV